MSNGNRIVIGLTGPFGAGCTTIADDLCGQYNFCKYKYSLSEVMREIAPRYVKGVDKDKLYDPKNRSYQQYIGNEIRNKKIDAIPKGVLKRIKKDEGEDKSLKSKDIVIDGIRNPREITFFQDIYPHFFVIAVFATYQVRWSRKSDIYNGNQYDFDRDDVQDSGEFEPAWGQKVQLCVDRSDVLISNNLPFEEQPRIKEELQSRIKGYIDLMKSPGKTRPQPWELNMSQAYQASLMATCCKRKVGAVIVKEQALEGRPRSYVIASGCNEAPLTVIPCIQRGGTTKPDYCYRDEKIKTVLRNEYKRCPKCGAEIEFAEEFDLPFLCPNSECDAKIGRDFIPGRMLDLCIAVHAEQAALLQTSRFGSTQVEGGILYTTTFPCPLCAKEIVNAGISRVVFAEPYPQDDAIRVLEEANVPAELFEGVKGRAYNRLFEPPPYKPNN